MKTNRRQAAADALGSVRAEGLEPGPRARALLDRWARGELTDAQLTEARRRVARGESIDDMVSPPTAALPT